jgi:hypothetical protein
MIEAVDVEKDSCILRWNFMESYSSAEYSANLSSVVKRQEKLIHFAFKVEACAQRE